MLRASLKQYIAIHTNAQRYEANFKSSNPRNHRRIHSEAGRTPTEPSDSTETPVSAEALVTNSRRVTQRSDMSRSHKKEPSITCIFCKGVHFNDSCDKFITVADRKGRLISQGRCFVCLKVGHTCKECPCAQSRSCHYCKQVGHHHRSICPKHFTVSSNSDTNQAPSNINQVSVNVNSSEAGQPRKQIQTHQMM